MTSERSERRNSYGALLLWGEVALALALCGFLALGTHRPPAPLLFDSGELVGATRIKIDVAKESIVLTRGAEAPVEWRLASGELADTKLVRDFLLGLSTATVHPRSPAQNLELLGLAPPQAHIEIAAGSDPVLLELGARNDFLGGRYVRRAGHPVALARSELLDPELATVAAFRASQIPMEDSQGTTSQNIAAEVE